jgi:hypothetical protein
MDAVKRGRGRPRGGVFGALRVKLAAMSVGQSGMVALDEVSENARSKPRQYVNSCCRCAARDIGGARFSLMTIGDHVWVRREA